MTRAAVASHGRRLAAALVAAAGGRQVDRDRQDSNLPRPNRKPADHNKKVRLFILLGQPNMLGCK
jgi:hypothetical protein